MQAEQAGKPHVRKGWGGNHFAKRWLRMALSCWVWLVGTKENTEWEMYSRKEQQNLTGTNLWFECTTRQGVGSAWEQSELRMEQESQNFEQSEAEGNRKKSNIDLARNRKSQKKEDAGARKIKKVTDNCEFQGFVTLGGWKTTRAMKNICLFNAKCISKSIVPKVHRQAQFHKNSEVPNALAT